MNPRPIDVSQRCPALAALLATGLALLTACASPPPALPLVASQAFAWSAENSSAGGGNVVLLGSVHMGRAPIELGPVLAQAFARSDVLVLELNPNEVGFFETLRLMGQHARLSPPETLADHLCAETYLELTAWAKRRGRSMSSYTPFKPWLVAMMVEVEELQAQGYRPEYGSEHQLIELAEDQDKRIEELESASEQFQVLASLSAEAQQLMLEQALAADDGQFEELTALLRSGDSARMLAFLMQDMEEPGARELYDRVLFDRNQTMTQRLVARTSDGRDRFVAVGAAHMLGPRGIPALLEQRGFRVRRLGR